MVFISRFSMDLSHVVLLVNLLHLVMNEHKKVIEECMRVVDKRVPVIAGTGSNNTSRGNRFY